MVNDDDYASILSGQQHRSDHHQNPSRQRNQRNADHEAQQDGTAETSQHQDPRRNVLSMAHGNGLKHYLELADDVVDAPSIGPRMAERMAAAGIHSVADLLRTDAATIADSIDHERTNAATVQRWQLQTEMCVRIPQLRGHDAQILVACGVETTEQLAASSVETLWAKVEPFVATNAGKRILRNGKQPDISEVRDWVTWANHARMVNAA